MTPSSALGFSQVRPDTFYRYHLFYNLFAFPCCVRFYDLRSAKPHPAPDSEKQASVSVSMYYSQSLCNCLYLRVYVVFLEHLHVEMMKFHDYLLFTWSLSVNKVFADNVGPASSMIL